MNGLNDSGLAAGEGLGPRTESAMAPVEHWAFQVESPFRPVEELLQLAEASKAETGVFEDEALANYAAEASAEEADESLEAVTLEQQQVTGPPGENALQPGQAARWVPIVDGRVRALFCLSGPGLAGRVRFLDRAGFAARFPRDDLVRVLVNQFSLPVDDQAGTPIQSILRHHHMADLLGPLRDEKLLVRRRTALRTFIRERIRAGAFLQTSPFGVVRHTPRGLVAQLIGGFTTGEPSRSGRRVLVQMPADVELLVHEACHFYAANAFNVAIRTRARDRVFVGMPLSEILAEGMAELFAREVMRANAATLGPIRMDAYQGYVEAAWRFIQTAGEEHARAAYFNGSAAAINGLFRAIDLNIRDYPLMVPAFMLSLLEQEELDGVATEAFDEAGATPYGEAQSFEIEEADGDELEAHWEADREGETEAEREDSESDATEEEEEEEAEESWELEEPEAELEADELEADELQVEKGSPSETEYEAEWELGEGQVAPAQPGLARTPSPLTTNPRRAGRRPTAAAASPREVPESYEAELGEAQITAPLMRLEINWCQMRQTIATIARAENTRWTRPDGTKFIESDPSRLPILTQYWSTVPGFGTPAAAGQAAQHSANDDPNWPWSAAFICFVMHAAGVQQAHGFEFARRHMNYIVGALRNRERSDRTRPFWLVDHVELQREAVPQSGDLLCFNRLDANGVMTQHTYARLRNQFWSGGNQNQPPSGSSHCRIVVASGQARGQRFIATVGGNEGPPGQSSIRLRRIPVDQFGGIPNPQAHNIFGMIKLIGC